MYKTPDYDYEQLSFMNFNSTCGMQLDPNNEWIRISRQLPWRAWESLYSLKFPADTGNVAKPCRMVRIGVAAFRYCSLFDIDTYSGFETLPKLTVIGELAFYNCGMKKFVIPEQITYIGRAAFSLNGDYGRNPEEAEIIVMGDATGYEADFCTGKAIPVFTKGLEQVNLGIQIWQNYNEPDKNGKMLIGCTWQQIGGIDGYEYEASVNEDFSGSVRIETTSNRDKVIVEAGKGKVTTLYARVRAYKVTDDSGTREYTEWSSLSWDID